MPDIIAANVVVTIDYTLTNNEGEVLDSSVGDDPLTYLQGHGNIVPGLENALAGKRVGESLKVSVPPEEGYGVRDPAGVRALPRNAFPADAELAVGSQFMAELEDDEVVPLWVVELDDETIHVDMNHPLAGETLNFQVEIVELRDASAEELAHGHPHGRDGHGHHGHEDHDAHGEHDDHHDCEHDHHDH